MKSSKNIAFRIVHTVANCVLVFIGLGLLATAYGGCVSPERTPWGALLAMCFPGFLILAVIALVIEIAFKRRWQTISLLIMLIAVMPSIRNYCPINLTRESKNESQTFTVMTYNTLWFVDYQDYAKAQELNPTVQAIIDANPDIFVTQEGHRIVEDRHRGITAAQVDTINSRYPYQFFDNTGEGMMLYSRFPVTRFLNEDILSGSGVYTSYKLSIQGHLLTLYDIHLQSIGLTPEDKALYEELLDHRPSAHELSNVKNQILEKLFDAFDMRNLQAQMLRQLIDDTGGNLILCGDFNDIPGCHAIRTIRGDDMRDAYVDAGLGPGISFRANHMLFRIDHMLYRGDFHALKSRRLKVGASDHYPLITTFEWNK